MTPPDQPAPPSAPPVWPPSSVPDAGVWPPAPISDAPGFVYGSCIVPFSTLFLRIKGSVSDFRTGSIEVQQAGLSVMGKAVPNAETQIPILIVAALLRVGWLLAVLVMEYGFRKSKWLVIPWENIQQVGLVPNKSRVCLVFDAPNDKGVVKTFSLAFKLAPEQYTQFVSAVKPFVTDRIGPSNLIRWNSPGVVMFLTVFAIALTVVIVIGAIKFLQH
ncbi:hypothetical protein CCAX7_37880 [Capsulimonas corticalis]|uniref:Uncharacterized protein n=1 Tax=Capsulimonas corticalis TaxID=2219043 RepID=A0A402D114_9BACT|nr:hypothetical protein [Capsulimonas corticalis]BDI31737.1 hypothetical protein CCAX7_37880 [Capsulimonas corticalis]